MLVPRSNILGWPSFLVCHGVQVFWLYVVHSVDIGTPQHWLEKSEEYCRSSKQHFAGRGRKLYCLPRGSLAKQEEL